MSKIGKTLGALMEIRQVSQYALSAATGVPQPTIQRILAGKSGDPRTGTLEPLAKYFGLSAADLRAGVKQSRGKIANVTEMPRYRPVPIISWVQAGLMRDIEHIPDPESGDWKTAEPEFKIGPKGWALRVDGDSMDDGTPDAIPAGYVIFCDPDPAPSANCYVIAKDVATQQATFKKLVTDGGRWYLKPLNRAYPTIEIDDPALRVIAVVTEVKPPSRKL